MNIVNIVPLSVNRAWQGRRFKTDEYKAFAQEMMWKLPHDMDIPDGELMIHFEFGFSNRGSDYDNPIKPAQDVICKHYDINDNRIYRAVVDKFKVPKGREYIAFKIEKLDR